jgi:hypothetical protein
MSTITNASKDYATDGSSEEDEAKEEAFATGNLAMTLSESKQRNLWFT